ncbi:uncharacterized protein LOC135206519 [Macrobrachium nipponense]|uniref:uncharacterized protein LOC135206519 n=1 Tax=Macrobrachium nipponense TaxID=159736 RepID=UPI0030C885ED
MARYEFLLSQLLLYLLLLLLLLLTSAAARSPHRPAGPCDAWCGNPPFLLCCDNRCPVDIRAVSGCARISRQENRNSPSGPRRCRHNIECPGDSLCCWDSCAGFSKCIDNVSYSIASLQ